jgi:heme exporter protein CcmD
MSSFFAMGGYAWYVWMAYGVTALVIAVEVWTLRARRYRTLVEAKLAEPEIPITTRSSLDPAGTA